MTNIKQIPIGGIKFSEERIHYTLTWQTDSLISMCEMLQQLYSQEINIPFFSQTATQDGTKINFCVAKKDAEVISKTLPHQRKEGCRISSKDSVGSVTLFPHKKELTLPAIVMSLMESISQPIYSSCSSISAFVFNTDFNQLHHIATELTSVFELPENHSPFHQQFRLCQPPKSSTTLRGK